MGQVPPKNLAPNSPLGRELPPRGGGVSQGDGTLKGPKGQIEGAAVSQFLHLVSVTYPPGGVESPKVMVPKKALKG